MYPDGKRHGEDKDALYSFLLVSSLVVPSERERYERRLKATRENPNNGNANECKARLCNSRTRRKITKHARPAKYNRK